MSRQRLVLQQFFQRIKGFGQYHFIIFAVDPPVTKATDPDPCLQGVFTVVPPEVRPAMDFFRYQVVKGERNPPLTTGAGFRHMIAQLCAEGNAALMAVCNSSLSGFTPLEKCPTISPSDDTTYLLKFQRG